MSDFKSAGSYVIHYANKVHHDGAKNEEAVIQIRGMGPRPPCLRKNGNPKRANAQRINVGCYLL